jgi:two-component system response regulator HydG
MSFLKWFKHGDDLPASAQCAPEASLQVLAVSLWLNDRLVLEQLGRREGWALRFTNSPPDAFRLVKEKHYDVVLCDRNQPGFPWREAMERLAENSPDSRILLVAPVTDDYLWRDVIQQGGYGVLTRPLHEGDALHTIGIAAGLFVLAGNSDSR